MNTAEKMPDGYMRNPRGHLVPVDSILPLDLLRDELVINTIKKVRILQEALRTVKRELHSEISNFLEIAAMEYQTLYGGNKGNVSLSSFDGKYKIARAIDENIAFDERLHVAKNLIDQCVHQWTEGSSSEVKALVEHAFQTDKAGKISTARVLGLRRLDIRDETWQRAMEALSDSIFVTGSKTYIRFYERTGSDGKYEQITLDFAAL